MNAIAKLTSTLLLTALPHLVGQTLFTKITTGEIVTDALHSYGCAWGDFDGDGWIDLFVANGWEESNSLYRNNRDGTFSKVSTGPVVTDGGDSVCGVWADCDNDGDLDHFVTNFGPPSEDFFYRNNGDGTFTKVSDGDWVNDAGSGISAAWGDYDNDGFVDLCVGNALAEPGFLYRNNGDGTMSSITGGTVGGTFGNTTGCSWGDYDSDGDLDLAVAQAFTPENRVLLFVNDGQGGFSLLAIPVGGSVPHSPAWGDFNNDALVDLAFACGGSGTMNLLFIGTDSGELRRVTDGPFANDTEISINCSWGDLDNDGYLDLFVANGGPMNQGQDDSLYHNNGDGSFSKMTEEVVSTDGVQSNGSACGDYDNDGDLDLAVATGGAEGAAYPLEANLLYRNNGSDNAWLLVRLIGTVSNRSGIGAKVRTFATIRGQELRQLREISGGSGYCSQNDLRAHFGLGDATQVDLLRIEWPSGIVQEFKDVAARQIHTVTEPPRLVPRGAGAFQIQCWINQSFEVQASMDLVEWSAVETVTNLTGTLVFEDAEAHQHESRYYRVATTP